MAGDDLLHLQPIDLFAVQDKPMIVGADAILTQVADFD